MKNYFVALLFVGFLAMPFLDAGRPLHPCTLKGKFKERLIWYKKFSAIIETHSDDYRLHDNIQFCEFLMCQADVTLSNLQTDLNSQNFSQDTEDNLVILCNKICQAQMILSTAIMIAQEAENI